MRKISLIILLCFASCKNDSKQDVQNISKDPEVFEVKLNMIVESDDSFQIFYTQSEGEQFDEKNSIWKEVKGSTEPQEIVFKFNEDVLPNNLRIDLGVNKNQMPMKLISLKMEYFDKAYELKDTMILKNFVISEQLDYDKSTSTLFLKKQNFSFYDPLLYPQDNLKQELLNLIR